MEVLSKSIKAEFGLVLEYDNKSYYEYHHEDFILYVNKSDFDYDFQMINNDTDFDFDTLCEKLDSRTELLRILYKNY